MPYIIKSDKKTGQIFRILIDTGATSSYIRAGIYNNKNVLAIKKRVRTINGSTIIEYFHNINLFGIQERFYEIDNLESDLLIGVSFLDRIGARIDIPGRMLVYGDDQKERIHFLNDLNNLNPLGQNSLKAPADDNTGLLKGKNEIKNIKKDLNYSNPLRQESLKAPADGNTGNKDNKCLWKAVSGNKTPENNKIKTKKRREKGKRKSAKLTPEELSKYQVTTGKLVQNENSINNILTEGSCQFLRVGKKSSDEKGIIKDLQNEASNEILTIHGDVNLNLPFRTVLTRIA